MSLPCAERELLAYLVFFNRDDKMSLVNEEKT
jgi:hypothetical protein